MPQRSRFRAAAPVPPPTFDEVLAHEARAMSRPARRSPPDMFFAQLMVIDAYDLLPSAKAWPPVREALGAVSAGGRGVSDPPP